MKVVLLGSRGQLAHDLDRLLRERGDQVVGFSHRDLCVEDREAVREAVRRTEPEVVINTAAFHRVDDCESRREYAFEVNARGAAHVALAAEEVGACCVFYSTDYVFGAQADRNRPYTEGDLPGPVNVYGWTKLCGEAAVRGLCARSLVIRSSGLYGVRVSGKGHHFPGLMMKLAAEREEVRVVDDQRLTPTHTLDLARATLRLLDRGAAGLYHLTNTGECTWYGFARFLFDILGIETRLVPVTSSAFPHRASRPAYSVLDNAAYRETVGEDLPPWQEALEEYLRLMGRIRVSTGFEREVKGR